MTPREHLLRAAIPLFAMHGYDAVSTGQIARAANLTQPMVHYHFKSKERIWREAIDLLMSDLTKSFPNRREELRSLEPLDRLKVMTRRFILMSASEPTLSRIIMHEGLAQSDRLVWLVRRYVARAFRDFDDTLRQGMEAGTIKPLPVYAVSNTIVSASSFTFSLAALVQTIYQTDIRSADRMGEMADAITEILFHGFVARS